MQHPQLSPGEPCTRSRRTRVIVVGGVDPSAGAGLLRDVLTANALGSEVRAVGTAWTLQDGRSPSRVEPRAPADVREALRRAVDESRDVAGCAVKLGMLATPAILEAVRSALEEVHWPIVVDPVLAATVGAPLWTGAPSDWMPILRRATLATPNLAEAAALSTVPIKTVEHSIAAGTALLQDGVPAVLVKGGHFEGEPIDVLLTGNTHTLLRSPRIPGRSPRGTGCTLATAIAAHLACGSPLRVAVEAARAWLVTRIEGALERGEERHLP